jgi:hypothetical protein
LDSANPRALGKTPVGIAPKEHNAGDRNHTKTHASRRGRSGRRGKEEKILFEEQDSEPLQCKDRKKGMAAKSAKKSGKLSQSIWHIMVIGSMPAFAFPAVWGILT